MVMLALTARAATNSPPVEINYEKPAADLSSSNVVELEYQKILDHDNDAQEQTDQIIQDNKKFAENGAGLSNEELNRKLRGILDPVGHEYESFLKAHPNHAKAHIAYGSFLGDLNDEDGAETQYELALKLETNNPAIYNNLANIYGHHGPVKKAFEFYSKAIALNPTEPVYYHNFGTTVYLFRPDAREYYGITEQQVFDKALTLYSNAMRLDPTNFPLASDVAQTYYGIKPTRVDDALRAWTNALKIAHDDVEREGVYTHFARVKMHAGRFEEARAQLNLVTNAMYDDLKKRLIRSLGELEAKAKGTNGSSAGSKTNSP